MAATGMHDHSVSDTVQRAVAQPGPVTAAPTPPTDRYIPVSLAGIEVNRPIPADIWNARGVLLMQSSGVGNCINMLGLPRICRLPLLMLITMRGEWGEFNPWQVPMGSATQGVFETMGVRVQRADRPDDVEPVVRAALDLAFRGGTPVAVLLGQRLIGTKVFTK
mgnify:CR=1 FL=1